MHDTILNATCCFKVQIHPGIIICIHLPQQCKNKNYQSMMGTHCLSFLSSLLHFSWGSGEVDREHLVPVREMESERHWLNTGERKRLHVHVYKAGERRRGIREQDKKNPFHSIWHKDIADATTTIAHTHCAQCNRQRLRELNQWYCLASSGKLFNLANWRIFG